MILRGARSLGGMNMPGLQHLGAGHVGDPGAQRVQQGMPDFRRRPKQRKDLHLDALALELQKFVEDEVSWFDVLPDFAVFILPIVGGIVLLVGDFAWLLVVMLALLIILSFGGNAVIRGSFACKYCKQREIGCPAEKLFGKGTKQIK